MIAYLRGKVLRKLNASIILEVASVGYKVFVNEKFLANIELGQELETWIHQHVREDSLALYGFVSEEELELFELLLSISGIGPKSALAGLTIATPADLKNSIASGDASLLTKVSGIGKKTAERVVLELKDKIATINFTSGLNNNNSSAIVANDEIDALVSLGYTLQQARDALSAIGDDIKDSGERVKQALKNMK